MNQRQRNKLEKQITQSLLDWSILNFKLGEEQSRLFDKFLERLAQKQYCNELNKNIDWKRITK